MSRLLAALLVIASVAAARADEAAPDDLATARAQIKAVQLDDAYASLQRALAAGGRAPDEVQEIYRLLGQVAAVVRPAEARDWFARLLCLAPDATLPETVAPKIRAELDGARTWLDGKALVVRAELSAAPRAVVLVVDSDPFAMVAGAEARWPAGRAAARGTGRVVVAITDVGRLEVTLSAIDEHGNRLLDLGATGEPIVVPAVAAAADPAIPVTPPAARTSPPLYATWYLWAGAAGAVGLLGGYFALDAQAAQDDLDRIVADSANHTYGEARDVLDRGQRSALVANIAFATAGVCAGAATWLFVTRGRWVSGRAEQRTTVTPAIGPNEAGVTVLVRF